MAKHIPLTSEQLKELAKSKQEIQITFSHNGFTRNVTGKLEASSSVEMFGWRFRFEDEKLKRGNIGLIFPNGRNSQVMPQDCAVSLYRDARCITPKYFIAEDLTVCSRQDCCSQWGNNYLRKEVFSPN